MTKLTDRYDDQPTVNHDMAKRIAVAYHGLLTAVKEKDALGIRVWARAVLQIEAETGMALVENAAQLLKAFSYPEDVA